MIQGLIDAVGPKGLIAMPGFSDDAYDPVEVLSLEVTTKVHEHIKQQVPGFDSARSNVRQNGAVPEAFRSWPGVIRSPHPTSSVLLLGPDAQEISLPHDPHGWPTGPDTPWSRLRFRPHMKVLLVGVGWNRCSALHAAESSAEYKRTTIRTFKFGTGPGAHWIKVPDVSDDLGRLFPLVGAEWERTGVVRAGKIGAAEFKLTGYAALVSFASRWISERNKADGVLPSTY